MTASAWRSRFVNAAIVATTLVMAFGLAEVALEWLAPVPDPYRFLKNPTTVNAFIPSAFTPHTSLWTVMEPGLPGMTGRHHFTTDNLGFRGDSLAMPKPADEVRVFMIGGSTVECLYLDDADAITAVLQHDLQAQAPPGRIVRVYGAGKSGDRSDDHVAMLVQRIVHLDPDVIVVMAGVNDLSAAIYGYDYLHFPIVRDSMAARLGLAKLVRFALTQFQIPRRVYYLAKRVQPSSAEEQMEELPLTSDYHRLAEKRKAGRATDRPPPTSDSAYARNLRTIAGVARAQGFRLVFVTQPSSWAAQVDPALADWQWMRLRNGRAWQPAQMDRALEHLNGVLRDEGARDGVPVYDLSAVLPKTHDVFYDDVHFNTGGARVAADDVARFLVARDIVK